jgi:hypothetical protein
MRLFQATGFSEIPDSNRNPLAAHGFEKRLPSRPSV